MKSLLFHLSYSWNEEEDFPVHHDVRLVLLLLSHFNVVAPVLILILNLLGAHEVLIPEVVRRGDAWSRHKSRSLYYALEDN